MAGRSSVPKGGAGGLTTGVGGLTRGLKRCGDPVVAFPAMTSDLPHPGGCRALPRHGRGMGDPAPTSQDGAVGYQSLPLDLVASLPHLPFPVYLRRDDRMVLYASPGADPRAILGHARSGLEVHVPSTDARVLRELLVVLFARALAPLVCGQRATLS